MLFSLMKIQLYVYSLSKDLFLYLPLIWYSGNIKCKKQKQNAEW